MFNRREMIASTGAAAIMGIGSTATAAAAGDRVTWISTTPDALWRQQDIEPEISRVAGLDFDIVAISDGKGQRMTGFGAAFSELGWDALSALPNVERKAVMRALFAPDGANFSFCRTPIGANDFSLGWYSYDEVDGDFDLKSFSIAHDRKTLIPFIRSAQAIRPDLRLWASPWSPPTWMKTNKFHAMAAPFPGQKPNGIKPAQQGRAGRDGFMQQDRYFETYARYFRRYVEGYRAEGIPIATVMPQNEFNSLQTFPSCNWTPQGLARFLPFLNKEMGTIGVDIFLGTMENADPEIVVKVLDDAVAATVVKGLGIQWAGKGAAPELHRRYPTLPIWGTEQECGNGRNDWIFARYAWAMMKQYLDFGASVYQYWNIALSTDPFSTWGWKQNSLITVDKAKGTYWFNPDYYVMRHMTQFVRPGARYVKGFGFGGNDSQMVFHHDDGSYVVLVANVLPERQTVSLLLGSIMMKVDLPGGSFNTIVIPPSRATSV